MGFTAAVDMKRIRARPPPLLKTGQSPGETVSTGPATCTATTLRHCGLSATPAQVAPHRDSPPQTPEKQQAWTARQARKDGH